MRKPNARERILETAAQLFHERGYSEVGINEIIEKADTAKASFYHYFRSKESLCEAWLEHVHARSEARCADILESDATPAEKVRSYFDHLEAFMIQKDFRGCPYSNTGAVSDQRCAGIAEQIREHKDSMRKFFRAICEARFDDPERAREIADRIFLLYSGAATEAQNLHAIWPVQSAREGALALLEP